MDNNRPKCAAAKKNGEACPNPARDGKDVCWVHDPALAGKRAVGRKRGGIVRSSKVKVLPFTAPDLPLSNPAEVLAALALTFNQVRRGEIGVPVANVLAIIAGTILKAQAGADVLERLQAWEEAGRPCRGG